VKLLLPTLLLLATGPAAAQESAAEPAVVHAGGEATVELRTAALLMSGQQGGSIPMAALAVPVTGVPSPEDAGAEPEEGVAVTAVIEIPGPGLLAAAGGATEADPLVLEVFVYALAGTSAGNDDGPEVIDQVTGRLVLDPPFPRRFRELGIKLLAPLRLPPGDHRLRALVRGPGDALGLRTAGVTVPDVTASDAAAPDELFSPPYPDPGGWLVGILREPVALPASFGVVPEPEPAGAEAPEPAPAGAPSAEGAPPIAVDESAKEAARELAAGYRRVLHRLAGGDRAGAVDDLRRLEVGAVEALGPIASGALEHAETSPFRNLPAEGWRGVLPVLLLHAETARVHRLDRRLDLAEHGHRMTLLLAGAYAHGVDTPEAGAEAARTLVDHAVPFLRRGPLRRAVKVLSHALELDPEEETALLTVAGAEEKLGRHQEARRHLERLVELQSQPAEGRLRLAIHRARAGDVDEARALFRPLTRDPAPRWIAVLAHQELARLELADDRLEEAEAVLRRALERWPDHPTLLIQRAHLLDRTGRRGEAVDLLHRIDLGSAAVGGGERSRYNRWPLERLEELGAEIRERADGRLPELRRLLGSEEGSG
jgi:tetratricopeptide (TPR) repeat protein